MDRGLIGKDIITRKRKDKTKQEVKDKSVKNKDIKNKGIKDKGVKDKGVKNKGIKNKRIKNKSIKNSSVKNSNVKNKSNKNRSIKNKVINKNTGMLVFNIDGTITVEAAFVMPIVMLTIFALIYLSFLLHDQNRIQGTLNRVLHKSSLSLRHESNFATGAVDYERINDRGVFYTLFPNTRADNERIENYLLEELKVGLFQYEIKEVRAEVGAFSIEIEVIATTKVKLPIFQQLLQQFSYHKNFASTPIHKPAESVRCAEVILETGKKLKGVEELKNALEKLFHP